jgi:hypothetical protein
MMNPFIKDDPLITAAKNVLDIQTSKDNIEISLQKELGIQSTRQLTIQERPVYNSMLKERTDALLNEEGVDEISEAKSKAQQRLFGAALATRRGEYAGGTDKINRVAADVPEKELKKLAKGKTKGLPEKIVKEGNLMDGIKRELSQKAFNDIARLQEANDFEGLQTYLGEQPEEVHDIMLEYEDLSELSKFGAAFKMARNSGVAEFTHNGKSYNTRHKGESDAAYKAGMAARSKSMRDKAMSLPARQTRTGDDLKTAQTQSAAKDAQNVVATKPASPEVTASEPASEPATPTGTMALSRARTATPAAPTPSAAPAASPVTAPTPTGTMALSRARTATAAPTPSAAPAASPVAAPTPRPNPMRQARQSGANAFKSSNGPFGNGPLGKN